MFVVVLAVTQLSPVPLECNITFVDCYKIFINYARCWRK